MSLPWISIRKSEINGYVQVDLTAPKNVLEEVYSLSDIKLNNMHNIILKIKQFGSRLERSKRCIGGA